MSLIFDVSTLSEQNRESIAEELVVDINDGPTKNRFQKKKMPGTGPKYMYPYRMIGSGQVSLPMAWALKRMQGATRRPRTAFTQTSYEYNATLRAA